MKRLLSLVVFCLVGSVVGLGIPGIDPALVLAIGVTLGPLSAWTCALCIGIIGLVTEAVMLQPIGSVVGPLLIVCGVGRWALVRLHLTMFIPLAAWSLGLGVIGLVVETIGVGRPRTDWLSLAGLAAFNGLAGLAAVYSLRWWLRRSAMLGRRRHLRLRAT